MLHRALTVTALCVLAGAAAAAPRDVQIRSVDFETGVVELFNFGSSAEPLDGWRFCTHDEDQVRRYSAPGGLDGVSVAPGGSVFIHYNDDAPADPSRINIAALGGSFAQPLDPGSYGMGLYINSNFGSGASIADHLQWSIGGIDNASADERSDEAEAGGVWTDQTTWIVTAADTVRVVLDDTTGAVLHGPDDYTAVGPAGGCNPADCDENDVLNVDDVDCFVAGFLGGDLGIADCDENGILNVDDIDCFVAAFLAGCP